MDSFNSRCCTHTVNESMSTKNNWNDSDIDGIRLTDGSFVIHHEENDDAWIEARFPMEITQ